MSSKIFSFIEEFTGAFGPIIGILPENLPPLQLFSSFLPLNFNANIIVEDTGEKYYFKVSPGGSLVKKGLFRSCPRTLTASNKVWIQIFMGKKTIMGSFNRGELIMTDVRVQYILRLAFLSEIMFNFAEKRHRLIRTGKYLKFPLFSKKILGPIMKLTIPLIKLIPMSFFESVLNKITPLLQSD